MVSREQAVGIIKDALQAVSPECLIREALHVDGGRLLVGGWSCDLHDARTIHILGSGKAAVGVARMVGQILGHRDVQGLVVSPYHDDVLKGIAVLQASHPLPSESSVRAAEAMMSYLERLSPDDFFIYLLSGGSSSLLEKPLPPLTLEDLQQVGRLMLLGGLTIEEMNHVRKHLSMVKGGRLGCLTSARGIVLVISDVIGDDLGTIGSAPFHHDLSTYRDARCILTGRGLWTKLPEAVRMVIEKGVAGEIAETPKIPAGNIDHVIIGCNRMWLQDIKSRFEALGMPSYLMTTSLRGEAREVAQVILALGEEIKKSGSPFGCPSCLIFGGETTVTVSGSGRGGRNQEMCLAALREISDQEGVFFMSVGSDGIDGNTGAAGAAVDCLSRQKARELGLDPEVYLCDNDAGAFLEKTGDLIITGPTGTNVMDATVLLVQ